MTSERRFKTCKLQGEWAELLFMARAAERGFSVSKPWGESQAYDVTVESGGEFLRVQVKSTHPRRAIKDMSAASYRRARRLIGGTKSISLPSTWYRRTSGTSFRLRLRRGRNTTSCCLRDGRSRNTPATLRHGGFCAAEKGSGCAPRPASRVL